MRSCVTRSYVASPKLRKRIKNQSLKNKQMFKGQSATASSGYEENLKIRLNKPIL